MKKTTLSLAIMTTLMATAPLAQAEVELYGKASAGFGKTYTHNVKNVRVDDQGSYIGFRGSEKLSDRAKAIWQVEQGVSLDDTYGSARGQKAQINAVYRPYVGFCQRSLAVRQLHRDI